MNYRLQYRNIGRIGPVEVQTETIAAAEALYMLLSGDVRVVSCAVWRCGDVAPCFAFDRSRPVVRERESVRIVRDDAEGDALTGVRPL